MNVSSTPSAALAWSLSKHTFMRHRLRMIKRGRVLTMNCSKQARRMICPITHRGFNDMIIKNKAIVEDVWTVLRLTENDLPETVVVVSGKIIVPLSVWQAQRDTLQGRADLGVWLASNDRPESLQEDVEKFSVIAVDFPKFADGRGYTIAYLLRERLGYK